MVIRSGRKGSHVVEHGQNEEKKNLKVAGNEWMWLKMLCNDQKSSLVVIDGHQKWPPQVAENGQK